MAKRSAGGSAAANRPPVLTHEHLERLEWALRQLHDIMPLIDGMEQCNEDCQQYRQFIDHMREQINTWRRVWFGAKGPPGVIVEGADNGRKRRA